jgi:hypothetical protein
MPTTNGLVARVLDAGHNAWRDLAFLIPSLMTRYCFVDSNADYRTCTLLSGSGRGGTTWLANVINYDNSYRLMFEPFKNTRVPQCRFFGAQQYLRPSDSRPEYLAAANSIFSGRIRNRWIDSHNRKLRPQCRLVKDIHTNLLLGWIHANFPEMPIILLLRHPCAVAYSRCMNRWTANAKDIFFNQPNLMEDYLEPFRPAFDALKDDFQRHIFFWCVETYVPLMQLRGEEILVTTYEDCAANPECEFKRIFAFLNKPFHREALAAARKPSTQARYNRYTRNVSAIILGESVVDSWQRSVRGDDVTNALRILEMFGLNTIYTDEALPKPGGIERYLQSKSLPTP